MPGLRIDFSGTEHKDFSALPRGTYHVKITDYEERAVKQGENKDKPYLNFEFTVQDGPCVDRKVWTNAMLFEPALFTMQNILLACGYNTDGELEFDPEDLLQTDLDIKVIVRMYEGDETNDIKSFAPWNGGESGGDSLLP